MATPDHKAHARRSVFTDAPSTPSNVDATLYPLSAAQETQPTHVSQLAGTSLAIVVIQGLLEYSDAYKRANVKVTRSTAVCPWPLTPAQTNGLNAAIHFLRHYVDLLTLESGG